MNSDVQFSSYGEYIEKTLEQGFTLIENKRDTDLNVIDVFKNKSNGALVVRIFSMNRNDDAFRALLGVKHKNLPEIFEVCANENCVEILESFVEGKTLTDVINEHKIDEKTAVKYLTDICSALSMLHEKQIIHRDIKPENIIITPDDTAVLIDLQSARISHCEKRDTINLGTVGYAAPEQYGISASIPATDIYALGVLLNEMLLGKHPSIETPKGGLGKIISKCTSTQIANRYQDVRPLLKALNRYKIIKI